MTNMAKPRAGRLARYFMTTALSAQGIAMSLSLGAAGIAALPSSAMAQANDSAKLGEVVVTARKRSESLLSVPIAVSVSTAADLQSKNITTITDLSDYTPGLTIDNNAADHPDRQTQNIFIRGMSSSVTPSVSVFIDGAPVSAGFVSNVSDAARVEILKGPQSAFFGRETFGGAINLVTKDPGNALAGSIDALYGNNNTFDIKANVEGALIKDVLTARLSVRGFSTDGQYTSSVAPYDKLGVQATDSVSLALKYTPTSDLTVKAYVNVFQDRDGAAPVAKYGASSYNCNAGAGGANNFYCGTLPNNTSSTIPVQTALDSLYQTQVFGNATKTLNPLFTDFYKTSGLERQAGHAHLNIDYKIPGTDFTLTSLTAGNSSKLENNANLDNQDTHNIFNFYTAYGIPNIEKYYVWNARIQQLTYDLSQEVRLTSDQSKRLRGSIGASYVRSSSQTYVDGLFPFGVASFGGGGAQIDDVYGVFGSISYDVTSKLTLSFDAREQHDDTKSNNRVLNGPTTVAATASSTDFLPRVIAQYHFTPSVMGYASFSRGVNPPVNNNALVGKPAAILAEFQNLYGVGIAVKPEYLDNYEVGMKGRFLDNRLQLSADGYYDNWTDQILSQFVSVPGIPGYLAGAPDAETVQANGGLTHLYGVEVDGQFAATSELVLSFSGAWNHTDIGAYPNYRCTGNACTPNGGITNINGHSLQNAPEYAANLAATYTGHVSDTMSWYTRGDYIYKGTQYTDLSNLTKIGASNRINVRAGLTKDTWTFEAFVLNLFDDRAYSTVNGTTDIDGQPNAVGAYPAAYVLGLPVLRQYGIRLRKTF